MHFLRTPRDERIDPTGRGRSLHRAPVPFPSTSIKSPGVGVGSAEGVDETFEGAIAVVDNKSSSTSRVSRSACSGDTIPILSDGEAIVLVFDSTTSLSLSLSSPLGDDDRAEDS